MDAVLALTVAVPLLGGAVVAGLGPFLPRRLADAGTIAVALATTVLCALVLVRTGGHDVVHWFGGWRPEGGVALGVDLVADPMAAALATLTAGLVVVATVFSWRYFETVRTLSHALTLVFCAAMVGFAFSGDLFNLFVFFELMSVAAYALTAYKSDERSALQGALNFAITNSVGAFVVLFGIALLYGRTGALNLVQIGAALSARPPDGLVIAALALVTAGFLVKAAAVPFHFWLADAHAVAPTPVCILFSGVMVELGLYAVARVYWTVFSGVLPPTQALRLVVVGLGTLTALVGAVMCLGQHHLKRLLALSTVSHSGVILIAVGLFGPSGLAGAGVYLLGHGAVKAALFVGAGIVLHRKGTVDSIRLHGRGRDLPVTAAVWALGGLALAGLPPFATYLGKGLIDDAAHEEHLTWLVAVTIVASAATGAAVLRAGAHVFLGWGHLEQDDSAARQGEDEHRETGSGTGRTPFAMVAPAVALLAGALALGLAPHLAANAERAAERFTDRTAQVATVLAGEAPATTATPTATAPATAPTPGAERPPPPAPSLSMALAGLLAAAGAVGIAALALWRHALPDALVRPVRAVADPPLAALRRLHSGHVGDYVTWVTFGTAVLGGLLALAARPG